MGKRNAPCVGANVALSFVTRLVHRGHCTLGRGPWKVQREAAPGRRAHLGRALTVLLPRTVSDVTGILLLAARDQSIDNAPMAVFVVAATALVLAMLRL